MLNFAEAHVAKQREVSFSKKTISSTSIANTNAVNEVSLKKQSYRDAKFNEILQSLLLPSSVPHTMTNSTHMSLPAKNSGRIKQQESVNQLIGSPRHLARTDALSLHHSAMVQDRSALTKEALSSPSQGVQGTANHTVYTTNNHGATELTGEHSVSSKKPIPNSDIVQTPNTKLGHGEGAPFPQVVTLSKMEPKGLAQKATDKQSSPFPHVATPENVTPQSESTQAQYISNGSLHDIKSSLNSSVNAIQSEKHDNRSQTTALGQAQLQHNQTTHSEHSLSTSEALGVVERSVLPPNALFSSTLVAGAPAPTLDIQSNSAVQTLHNFVIQQMHANSNSLSVQVNPQGMGNINILLQHQAGGAISIQVQSNNPQTVQWLQNQQAELTNALKTDGFSIANMQISYEQDNRQNSKDHQQPRRLSVNRTALDGVHLEEVPLDYQNGEVSTSNQVRRWFG